MLLYFTNNSKQRKILIETDYVEDVYDEIQAFFEDYNIRPHFIGIVNGDNVCKISWNSQSEMIPKEDIVSIWNYIVDAKKNMDDEDDTPNISCNCS